MSDTACNCGQSCPGSSEISIRRHFGDEVQCPNTATASVNNVMFGLAYGIFVMIPGAASLWDPLSGVKDQLSKSQTDYQNLANQWKQCLEQCQNCIVEDQLQLVNEQLDLITASQSLINQSLQQQISTLNVLVVFIILTLVIILGYIFIT